MSSHLERQSATAEQKHAASLPWQELKELNNLNNNKMLFKILVAIVNINEHQQECSDLAVDDSQHFR